MGNITWEQFYFGFIAVPYGNTDGPFSWFKDGTDGHNHIDAVKLIPLHLSDGELFLRHSSAFIEARVVRVTRSDDGSKYKVNLSIMGSDKTQLGNTPVSVRNGLKKQHQTLPEWTFVGPHRQICIKPTPSVYDSTPVSRQMVRSIHDRACWTRLEFDLPALILSVTGLCTPVVANLAETIQQVATVAS